MAFSVALALAAIFSERCDLRWGRNLSLSVFLALAFFTPTTAHSRCVRWRCRRRSRSAVYFS